MRQSACCGSTLCMGLCDYCGRPAERATYARPVRFHTWNTAGAVAMATGKALHAAGLWLCGAAGDLDAIADRYR